MRVLDTFQIRKYFYISLLLIYILLNIRYRITSFEIFKSLFIQILSKNVINCIFNDQIGLFESNLVNIPSLPVDYEILEDNNNTREYSKESEFLDNKNEGENKIQDQYLDKDKFEFKSQCQNKSLNQQEINIDSKDEGKFEKLPYLAVTDFKPAVYYSCFKLRYLLSKYRKSYRRYKELQWMFSKCFSYNLISSEAKYHYDEAYGILNKIKSLNSQIQKEMAI